jgi:arginine repressor
MSYRLTTLERAFDLARSEQFGSVQEIKKQLNVEGFQVGQITGASLSKQLTALIRSAAAQGQIDIIGA